MKIEQGNITELLLDENTQCPTCLVRLVEIFVLVGGLLGSQAL